MIFRWELHVQVLVEHGSAMALATIVSACSEQAHRPLPYLPCKDWLVERPSGCRQAVENIFASDKVLNFGDLVQPRSQEKFLPYLRLDNVDIVMMAHDFGMPVTALPSARLKTA